MLSNGVVSKGYWAMECELAVLGNGMVSQGCLVMEW